MSPMQRQEDGCMSGSGAQISLHFRFILKVICDEWQLETWKWMRSSKKKKKKKRREDCPIHSEEAKFSLALIQPATFFFFFTH